MLLILSLFHGTAGDVSRGAGGDSGRHRTHTVRQDPGAAFQTDLQMCLQPTFPGQRWLIVPFLTMPTFPVGWGWPNLYHGEHLCLNSYWLLKSDEWLLVAWRHGSVSVRPSRPRLQSELFTTGTTSTSWVWLRRTPASSCPSCLPASTGSPKSTGTRE